MTPEQTKVKDFMIIAGQDCPVSPTVPDEVTRKLRVRLIMEELLELAAASGVEVFVGSVSLHKAFEEKQVSYALDGACDLVGVVDGIADIKYVNEGAANAFGFDLEPFFNEVHRSNLTKRWTQDDLKTLKLVEGEFYYGNDRVTLHTDTSMPAESRRVTVKNASGKMIKSPTYEHANLASIVEAQSLHS